MEAATLIDAPGSCDGDADQSCDAMYMSVSWENVVKYYENDLNIYVHLVGQPLCQWLMVGGHVDRDLSSLPARILHLDQ